MIQGDPLTVELSTIPGEFSQNFEKLELKLGYVKTEIRKIWLSTRKRL